MTTRTALNSLIRLFASIFTPATTINPNADQLALYQGGTVKKVSVALVTGRVPGPDPAPTAVDGKIDLSGLDANYAESAETGPISGFTGLAENAKFEITFTNDGATLIGNDTFTVPGNVINIQAGDTIQLTATASGTEIVRYQKAAGDSAVVGAKASGWVQFTDWPANSETKDFNGLEVEFSNSNPATWPRVYRGANLADAVHELAVQLNAAVDAELVDAAYTTDNVDRIYIVANAEGEAMNSYDLTGGTADFTASGSTLTGGVDPPDFNKTFSGYITIAPVAFADLPTGSPGRIAMISDGDNSVALGGAAAGGSDKTQLVFYSEANSRWSLLSK